VLDRPKSWLAGRTVPIHFYGLLIRTDTNITCQASSRPTKMTYDLEENDAPPISGDVSIVIVPQSWNQITQNPDTRQYFTEKRNTAKAAIRTRKTEEAGKHIHTGWSDFPEDYPDETVNSLRPQFEFCTEVGVTCQ